MYLSLRSPTRGSSVLLDTLLVVSSHRYCTKVLVCASKGLTNVFFLLIAVLAVETVWLTFLFDVKWYKCLATHIYWFYVLLYCM